MEAMQILQQLEYPSSATMAKIANIKLSEYESTHTRNPLFLSIEEQERRMISAKTLIRSELDNNSFSDWVKTLNKAKRVMTQIDNPMPSIGEKAKKAIDILQHWTLFQLKKLEKNNFEAALAYVTGKNRVFVLETSTCTLNKAMNRDSAFQKGEGSFRGTKGIYAALQQLNFVFRKYNKSVTSGQETPKGGIVVLEINLDWIFGFSLSNSSRFSTTNESNIKPITENSYANLVGNTSSEQTNPPKLGNVAINIANHLKAKRETGKQSFCNETPHKIIACAHRSVKMMLDNIFTTQRFQENKVRVNKETALKAMPTGNNSMLISLMTEVINELIKEGLGLNEIEQEIQKTILAKCDYLDRYENKYIYPPIKFLEISCKGGLLWILRKRRETQTSNFQKVALTTTPSVVDNKQANINWFLNEGVHEYALKSRIKKWGVTPIGNAIALGRAKVKRGFEPQNGIISYIMGIIDHIESPEQIERDAVEQLTLWKNNISFGTPKLKGKKQTLIKSKNIIYNASAVQAKALQMGKKIDTKKAEEWATRLKNKENAENLLAYWIENLKNK